MEERDRGKSRGWGKELGVNEGKNFINSVSSTERNMGEKIKKGDKTSTLPCAAQEQGEEWK